MTKMLRLLMRGRLAAWLALLVLVAAHSVQAQETRPRIAVLDFQRTLADAAESAAITDQLRTELVRLKAFTVLERTQTEAVLGELAFQQEGFTDPSRAIEAGQLLNVEFVVTGRVTRLRDAYQVNAQMTAVNTGEIVRSESVLHRGDFVSLLATQAPRLAARLAGVESAPTQGGVTPPAAPQPALPTRVARSPWPRMGMMGGVTANWPLVVGGMMVMGGAMVAARSDGENRDAALAVGAVGVGLLGYYWINRSTTPDSASAKDSPNRSRPIVLVGLRRDGMGAGIAWRW